jgi:hypothetical protein
MKNSHHNTEVGGVFYAPVIRALEESDNSRSCKAFPDHKFLVSGIQRSLTPVASGRDWVQRMRTIMNTTISAQVFFSACKSMRRLKLIKEICENVRRQADALLKESDALASIPELDGFAVYASDGHTHKASAHENPIVGAKRPVTHIYSLNLRYHTLTATALSVPREGMKKEHEIATLKRIGADKLRMGEPVGTKVILVYDPAVIDYIEWYKWKKAKGIYIITVEKKNSRLTTIGYNDWDEDDPRNNGIISDEIVGPANGPAMRRIKYVDPVTGKEYVFITNEMTLPPGVLVFIYKMRWNVEKIFDQIKNKMFEKKAWATSENAKQQQAGFIALAHNLMLMLESQLEQKEGIVDEVSQRKRRKRLEQDIKKAENAGRPFNHLVKTCSRITQRCVRFIRWLVSSLESRTLWRRAVEQLRPLMARLI